MCPLVRVSFKRGTSVIGNPIHLQLTCMLLFDSQFNKLSIAVELAGGTPMLIEEGGEEEEELILQKTTCVMTCDPADPSQRLTDNAVEWINRVQEMLQT